MRQSPHYKVFKQHHLFTLLGIHIVILLKLLLIRHQYILSNVEY